MHQKSPDKNSKENKELRRQIEILKAQLKSSSGGAIMEDSTVRNRQEMAVNTKVVDSYSDSKSHEIQIDDTFVKKDLRKTAILSAIMLTIIFGLYFTGTL